MDVIGEDEHPVTGPMGHREHRMRCANCGHETRLRYVPGKGYA